MGAVVRTARAVLVAAVASGGAAGIVALAGPTALTFLAAFPSGLTGVSFPDALVGLSAAALVVAVAWLALISSWLAVTAARRRTTSVRGCPRLVRVAVLAAIGVSGVGAPALPMLAAVADPGPAGPVRVAPGRAGTVTGLPLPDLVPDPVPDRSASGLPVQRAGEVVVRPGDSLWSVAAATLPAGAADREITRRWHRIYLANRDRIGADPDLILPGTRLDLPAYGTHPQRPRKEHR